VRRPCLVGAALAAVAFALAGCGGSGRTVQQSTSVTTSASATATATLSTPKETVALGKTAYERTMRQLGRRLAGSVQGLFPLVETQPGTDISKETVAKLQRTRAVVTSVLAKAAAIAPPEPIRHEHQRLLQGISALGGELDELINVEEHGTSRAFGLYARFPSLRTIARARSAIEKKGYAIG
jgi:hypothetical protein